MRSSAVIAMALCGACAVDDRAVQLPEVPTQHKATSFDIPVGVSLELDILFVVDNSPAMAPRAVRATSQIAKLFGELQTFGDPDWHLAVITSDLGGEGCTERGDDGLFRSDGLVGAPYLIDWVHLDQRHTANYEGTLESAFGRLLSVGVSGCPRQQPLAAIRRALEHPRNAGFRRERANLMIVVVNAGDDASAEPIADHIAFLSGATAARQLELVGIYDRPAPRLDGVFAPLQPTFSAQVSPLSADDVTANLRIRTTGGGHWGGVPCLEGDIGPTPECSISDVIVEDDEAVFETLMPRCDASASIQPCWHIERDPVNCPSWAGSMNQMLEIERRDYPPVDTHVRGNCVTR